MARDIDINLWRDNQKQNRYGIIKVKLNDDYPEELLERLGKNIAEAFERWEDMIVKIEYNKQEQWNDSD